MAHFSLSAALATCLHPQVFRFSSFFSHSTSIFACFPFLLFSKKIISSFPVDCASATLPAFFLPFPSRQNRAQFLFLRKKLSPPPVDSTSRPSPPPSSFPWLKITASFLSIKSRTNFFFFPLFSGAMMVAFPSRFSFFFPYSSYRTWKPARPLFRPPTTITCLSSPFPA